ncbi:alpha/beta-hydrolase [Coniochaeta ligniaria NRRL 30616]|uniref:Carboxylic ester hydrolase n=1 Tax=Coniochaeta ligniaria NRRL 30616 TaxID=1408157 RepID=A0A1J7J1K8_9PEZI|nr:alpha/beta-hydrolase [Coniochaeta ligniaria NRRL 30616]
MVGLLRGVALLAALVAGAPSPQSLKSSISLLVDNDLQGASSPSADSAVILLSRRSQSDAAAACQALGEQLWSPETASIQANLDYLKYQGKIGDSTLLWIGSSNNESRAIGASGKVVDVDAGLRLPVLCTQTAPFATASSQPNTNAQYQVSVHSNNEDYTGFRDRLAFRFFGIRYAPQPKRFTYSTPYKGSGGSVSALNYGSECVQGNSGSEDCLFLNIWTNYLPKAGCKPNKASLKPVMFWIHGGAFTGGTANDNTFDGGNIVSRGDVVLVAINYRLTTLGFLALNDGVTNGNFGLADQINALDWVRANIRDFGGDPDRITIFGQSAGAGSVRAMMASPKAVGKFANAIPLSNLGGIDYGTTYSLYYTIDQEVQAAANAILAATNCTNAPSQVDCLRAVPATTLASVSNPARFLVVDGTYLTTDQLQLSGPRLPFNLLMGTMHDDGAPFITYPTTTNESAYLASSGFSLPPANLFPIPPGANQTLDLYNMTSRLATDGIFRCVDEATVNRGLATGRLGDRIYYYEFDRSYQTRGWPGTDVCDAPRTPSHPNGDPSLPYFKCHSGELYYVFGNLAFQGLPYRDAADLPFERFVLDSFSSFARTGDPNPDARFLEARGFSETADEIKRAGVWRPATKGDLTLRALDWPSSQGGFRELAQCEGLGLGLDYYG